MLHLWLHRFIILFHTLLVVSVTLGYFMSRYCFTEPMSGWHKIYLILYWIESKIQIADSGMLFEGPFEFHFSDLQGVRTYAKKDGSDWILNGSKVSALTYMLLIGFRN